MKKYKFKMQSLLFHRQTLEDQAQQDLAKQQRVLLKLQNELQETYNLYHIHIASSPKRLNAAELQIHNNYTSFLHNKILALKDQVRQQNKITDIFTKKLLAKHKDTKIVETLKEKDESNFNYQAKREETKQLDEFGSIRFNMKKKDSA